MSFLNVIIMEVIIKKKQKQNAFSTKMFILHMKLDGS